ncbi:MAG TPA: hypothetical protein PKV16_04925 [Caldisericia bacterium]|nr:hypothetical protein [Caldisericia bacterium]HPF48655.1 hypothetical protein [Caldisericia bacterium]HPI83685.1 hypothetical protein [Caldisericia bacterium]HPQ93110.1 hypothetical protein [Caldisericia bacterium]HRV75057.1 hypothetical protein [Caldisericia bacterium]
MKRGIAYPILLIFVAVIILWMFNFMGGMLSRGNREMNRGIEARPITIEQHR